MLACGWGGSLGGVFGFDVIGLVVGNEVIS